MTTDRTNRFPGQANDNSLVPAGDERTFRVNTDQATGVSESTIESTLKTLRGTGIGAVKESVTDHFVLKGLFPLFPEHAPFFHDAETDMLHPGTAGHRRIADAIERRLGAPVRPDRASGKRFC